jgi:hypothetical protein
MLRVTELFVLASFTTLWDNPTRYYMWKTSITPHDTAWELELITGGPVQENGRRRLYRLTIQLPRHAIEHCDSIKQKEYNLLHPVSHAK